MAKSPYQAAYENWNKRVAKYQSQGIPESVYLPIANQHLQRVYTQNSTDMTNEQADTAVYAAWKGGDPVAKSPRHSGGILGGIETVLGNVVPDVGNIITSLPRGLYDLGKDVVTPSQWENTGKDLAAALSAAGKGDLGQSVRDLSQSPFLNLIPGVADIADLTTSQGRTSLMEHPVTAALDVLPLTKPLSAGAGAALATRLGDSTSAELSAALKATGRDRKAAMGQIRSQDPSAVAALASGHPIQAALRGLDRTVGAKALSRTEAGQRAATAGLGPVQRTIQTALKKANLDALSQQALKQITREGQIRDQAAKIKFKAAMDDIIKPLGTEEAIQSWMRKAALGDTESMSVEERVAYDKAQALQHWELNPKLELYHSQYGVTGPGTAITRKLTNRDTAAKNVANIAEALARLRETGVTKVPVTIRGRRLMKDEAGLLKAYATHKAELKSRDRKVESELVKISGQGLPAHLHPQMRSVMAKELGKALEKQRIDKGLSLDDAIQPTEKLSAGRILQTYQQAQDELSNINSGTFSKFREYVGKKETKALFVDSAHELLRMSYDGLSPLFFHEPKHTRASDILNTHLAATKDISEAQTRKKLWNMHETVVSPMFGMSEQMAEIERRDGMQQSFDKAFAPHLQPKDALFQPYLQAAARLKNGPRAAKYSHISEAKLADQLFEEENVQMDFARYGLRNRAGKGTTELYLPKELGAVLEGLSGDTKWAGLNRSRGYNKVMKVFRTSVLYGPRHFAHVVIGGMMPLMLAEPRAILEFPSVWRPVYNMVKGRDVNPIKLNGKDVNLPGVIGAKFDYSTDAGYKILQTKAGTAIGRLLTDYWEKTGKKVGEGTQQIEDFAQSLYQAAAYMRGIKRGDDEMVALEHARDMVVNLDKLTPFERTVMKQVFPFYSFTRFAVGFLAKLPFDHPLRVALLSQLSNQAQEEWGTGLPQTMMSLFFFGQPDSKGNVMSMNLRNANPFRSVANMFTVAGFMQSLNPLLQAPFVAAGFNPMSGSSDLYPEITYNPQTGTLVAARPKGDWMLAAEQFMPELGGLDYAFGISSNLRSLKATDNGAFVREMQNMFNIPFQISNYNIPQTRARVAENSLKGAQNALTSYRKGGNYDDTIGRYALIPYNGQLIPPAEFKQYWEAAKAQVQGQYGPGVDPAAVLPKPQQQTTNTLQQLVGYYGQ